MTEHRPDSLVTGPGDAELIRYLDGELDAVSRARVERQLSANTARAQRLETLRQRGRRMAEMLAAADVHMLGNGHPLRPGAARTTAASGTIETPGTAGTAGLSRTAGTPGVSARDPRVWLRVVPGNTLLRAAIVVLALTAAALLAPPVRALVADGLARLAGVFRNEPPEPVPSASDATDVPDAGGNEGGMVVHFDVATADFRIDIDNEQAAGALVVRRGVEERASAEIDGPASQAELVVAGGMLRIRNRAEASVSYIVTLPPSVREIHIRLGRRAAITMPVTAEARIDLSGR